MTAIRPLEEADLPAVASIYAHYVANSVATFDESAPDVAAWRAKAAGAAVFLVAEDGGDVLGFAYAGQYRPKPGYRHSLEDTIYLAPGTIGRGLGRRLLGELIEQCRQSGARQLVAVVADSGDPSSLRLHESFGFKQAGRLEAIGFKHGRWIDTILLQLLF